MKNEFTVTESQAKALCNILKLADKFDYSHGKGGYEIKQYEVTWSEYFLSVVLEVGAVGDEGTLAAIICRDRVHLFVGKRGGITYPCMKGDKWFCKRLSSTNIYGVALDQK